MSKINSPISYMNMLPYTLPFALYLFFGQFSSYANNFYPLFYGISVLVVGVTAFLLLRGRGIVQIHGNILPGVVVGVVGIILWIVICRLHLEQSINQILPEWLVPGKRPAFNPFVSITTPLGQWSFIALRFMGLALLVPLIEEFFWRGFLIRWIDAEDWQKQEIGVFSLKSFLWTTFLFSLAHPEWFAAAVYCMLLNALLHWRRNLWDCIIAHGTSNLLLGIYVLFSGTWELW